MGGIRLLAAIGVLAAARPAWAEACDPAEATRRRAQIERQLAADAGPSRFWNTGWGIGLGTVAVVYGVFAARPEWTPVLEVDRKRRADFTVTAVKSGIGALARVVTPLRVGRVDPPTGDPCADLAAAERALAWTAKKQRGTFWLGIAGSAALNVGGGLVLGLGYDAWAQAAIQFALSGLVTTAMALTQPRGSWKLHRRGRAGPPPRTWLLAPEVGPDRVGLTLILPL